MCVGGGCLCVCMCMCVHQQLQIGRLNELNNLQRYRGEINRLLLREVYAAASSSSGSGGSCSSNNNSSSGSRSTTYIISSTSSSVEVVKVEAKSLAVARVAVVI